MYYINNTDRKDGINDNNSNLYKYYKSQYLY